MNEATMQKVRQACGDELLRAQEDGRLECVLSDLLTLAKGYSGDGRTVLRSLLGAAIFREGTVASLAEHPELCPSVSCSDGSLSITV